MIKYNLYNVWKGLIPLCWKATTARSMIVFHFRLIEYEKCNKIHTGILRTGRGQCSGANLRGISVGELVLVQTQLSLAFPAESLLLRPPPPHSRGMPSKTKEQMPLSGAVLDLLPSQAWSTRNFSELSGPGLPLT